jgi:hypothetical protein
MIIIRTDPFTGIVNRIDLDVTEEQLLSWINGEAAQ